MLPRCTLLLLLASAGVAGAEPGVDHGAPGEHHHHANHLAAFFGAATTEHGTGAAVGLDYERRFGMLGVAAVVDVARVDGETAVLAMPSVVVHPWRGAKALGGVGWEHAHGHDAVAYRVAVGYDVHVGAMSLGPSVALDRASGATSVVFGGAVGAGF